MNWQVSLLLMFGAFVALSIVACAIARRRKPTLLQAPQRTAIREVYNEHAYRVGNMRGVG